MLPGRDKKFLTSLGIAALCLVFGGAIGTMLDDGIDGAQDEMLKPVFRHVANKDRAEDILYLFPYCSPQFRYYRKVYNFGFQAEVAMPRKGDAHVKSMRKHLSKNKRVWLAYPEDPEDVSGVAERCCKQLGNIEQHFKVGESGVYLIVPEPN